MKLDRDSHLHVWESFAREIGALFVRPAGGAAGRIDFSHPRGALRIEEHEPAGLVGGAPAPGAFTKFSAHLPATRLQRFSVSRATFAPSVAEWFGALDIQVDDERFDSAFVLKGETPDLVRALFASASLRDAFLRDFEGQMHRRDDSTHAGDPTPGTDPFELSVPGFVDSAERLRALWALFLSTLERLPIDPSAGQ